MIIEIIFYSGKLVMPVWHTGLQMETCTQLQFPQLTTRRAPASYIITTTGTRRNRIWVTFSRMLQKQMESHKRWLMYDVICLLFLLCTVYNWNWNIKVYILLLNKLQGKEVESSTEESEQSSTPHQSNQQKPKAKGRAPVVPPMWAPGFPPVPPPGSHLRMVSK